MPKIQYAPPSEAYRAARQTGQEMGEGRKDCAVVAVSIASGRPYEECLKVMTKHGRKPNSGTYMNVTQATLEEFGFEMIKLSRLEMFEIISKYPGVHKNLKGITSHHPRRFPGAFEHLGRAFMMRSSRHISTVKDGVNEDWSQNNSLRIIEIYVVKAKQG